MGRSGTRHFQFYVEFSRRVRFAVVKTLFPRARLAERQGTSTEAADYCKKDGTLEEHGATK